MPLRTGDSTGVLFVSRRNSLRSVLAEACLEHVGRERFSAYSCGVPGQLARQVHPAALEALALARMAYTPGAPKNWHVFQKLQAPRLDFVILLDPFDDLDPPAWPGQPDMAVWALPDLAAEGKSLEVAYAMRLLHSLRRRLEILASLPMHGVDRAALRSDIRDLAAE